MKLLLTLPLLLPALTGFAQSLTNAGSTITVENGAEANAAQATAATEAFGARLRRLEAAGEGQARR